MPACLPCSGPATGDPVALGSPPETSSAAVVLGEDGDSSEVERETEDGEAGDDCPSDAESLGKLEVGMVTLSFEPENQAVESKKRFTLSKNLCMQKEMQRINYPLHGTFYTFNKNRDN